MNQPSDAPARVRGPAHVGPVRVTPARVAILLAFVGSIVYILWAVVRVRDTSQIPMLSTGFAVLGVAFTALAILCLLGMWRAASRARGGQAMALSIVGGLSGLGAIGSFTLMLIFALLWRS